MRATYQSAISVLTKTKIHVNLLDSTAFFFQNARYRSQDVRHQDVSLFHCNHITLKIRIIITENLILKIAEFLMNEKIGFIYTNTGVPKLTQDLNLPPFVQRSVGNSERKRISQLTI